MTVAKNGDKKEHGAVAHGLTAACQKCGKVGALLVFVTLDLCKSTA
jgi:hypothetical protein